MRKSALTAGVAVALAVPAAAFAGVSGTTGDVVLVPAAPPSAVEGQVESNDSIFLFAERSGVTLPTALAVDLAAPGSVDLLTWTPPATSPTVPAGTVVDSHFLHADPVGDPAPSATVRWSGSVSFDQDVVGVIFRGSRLTATDALLGAVGTTYPTGTVRGLDVGRPGDAVRLSADRRTLTLTSVASHTLDQLRVLTAVPQAGGEGCTPGYWKQPQHFDSYTGYAPTTKFADIFDVGAYGSAFGDKTLLQVLATGGGDVYALGRHAVAALLNAASGGVDSPLTTAEVIGKVNMALAGDASVSGTKNLLEGSNEAGCPLS